MDGFSLFILGDNFQQFLTLVILVGVVGYGTVDDNKQYRCDGYFVHLGKLCKVVQEVKKYY